MYSGVVVRATYVPEVKPIVSIVVICDFEWRRGGVADFGGWI